MGLKVGDVFSRPFPSQAAAERPWQEQTVPGDTTGISYEDQEGRWHGEVARGGNRPETEVKG